MTLHDYTACIDIGGTFTDCLVEDAAGRTHIFKAATTPGDFQNGFMDSLAIAAEHFGLDLKRFLAATRQIVHGSTVSTNALVEMKVAPTGYLCNEGHLDVLVMREAVRKPVFSWRLDFPDPYIPRSHTMGIRGRIDAGGNELTPLDEDGVRKAVVAMKAAGLKAIGVAYLWSILNPSHELRTRAIIREIWPEVPVTLSHQLNPVGREYRRSIATVIDASLQPTVSTYITKLIDALTEAGYTNELLLANCVGGMMPPDDLIARPIYSVMSGPTLAPVAARFLTREKNVIVADMGGTTFDVSAIRDGHLIVSQEAMIGNDMLGISKIDVRSVGAGGGSLAYVDAGGMLHVGPESASARPGPACYGRGGTKPTVTDANLLLGILDENNFLGGRMVLDRKAAEDAMAPLAAALGLSLEDTAYSIYTTSNNVMVGLIEDMTVKEGINPRDSQLVVGGGATAAHICEIANELGIARVLIPRFAAGLSAYGGLISDIRWEEQATVITASDRFEPDRINTAIATLKAGGQAFLDRASVPKARQRFELLFMARYRYQSWEIEVPLPIDGETVTDADLPAFVAAFHAMHERIYSVKMESDIVEFTTWKLRAIGEKPRRSVEAGILPEATKAATADQRRSVYFRERGGFVDCPIHQGDRLAAGAIITGPAVIEEPTTTIYLPSNARAVTDHDGNYVVTLH
ncbi:hydantoinase/oxoprolinase family protein [Ensifer soli]|uniref:hydantoinase/oxoprolinase family protein n=1 Tax=Ciceribacter sp. sgz301302 TaxID=3342379 RepID=UPI0035B9F694